MVTGVVTAWDLSTQKLRYVTRPQVPEVNLWINRWMCENHDGWMNGWMMNGMDE